VTPHVFEMSEVEKPGGVLDADLLFWGGSKWSFQQQQQEEGQETRQQQPEQEEPLAERLLMAVVQLLFMPGFTLPNEVEDVVEGEEGAKIARYVIW
jgi:hypothetical protein